MLAIDRFFEIWFPHPSCPPQKFWMGAKNPKHDAIFEKIGDCVNADLNVLVEHMSARRLDTLPSSVDFKETDHVITAAVLAKFAIFLDQQSRNRVNRGDQLWVKEPWRAQLCDHIALICAQGAMADRHIKDHALTDPSQMAFLSLVFRHTKTKHGVVTARRILENLPPVATVNRMLAENNRVEADIDTAAVERYAEGVLQTDMPERIDLSQPERSLRLGQLLTGELDDMHLYLQGLVEGSRPPFLRMLPGVSLSDESKELIGKMEWEMMLYQKKDLIIVSLSGGVDSSAHLVLLKLLRLKHPALFHFKLVALHISHCNRDKKVMQREEMWIDALCSKYDVPLYRYYCKLARPGKAAPLPETASTEETGDNPSHIKPPSSLLCLPNSTDNPSDITATVESALPPELNLALHMSNPNIHRSPSSHEGNLITPSRRSNSHSPRDSHGAFIHDANSEVFFSAQSLRADVTVTREQYEQVTRDIRFCMYQRVCEAEGHKLDECAVVLGHHQDDADENRVDSLCRGHLLGDLAGMPKSRVLYDILVLRPLIHLRKDDFLKFAQDARIPVLYDSTPKWSTRGHTRCALNDSAGIVEALSRVHSLAVSIDKALETHIRKFIKRINFTKQGVAVMDLMYLFRKKILTSELEELLSWYGKVKDIWNSVPKEKDGPLKDMPEPCDGEPVLFQIPTAILISGDDFLYKFKILIFIVFTF